MGSFTSLIETASHNGYMKNVGKEVSENTQAFWAVLKIADEMGDQERAQQLIVDFAAEATRMGQSIQAISMLKKLDKNYEVIYIDKIVENLKEEIIERNAKWYRRNKTDADSIEVSEDLKNALREAETEAEREAIREEIYEELANQLPPTWVDRWNAWRYFAMLANARTHIRNFVGNAFFMPMICAKNIASKIIEGVGTIASHGKMERSKTFIVPKKYKIFAEQDVKAMSDELTGGGKHNPSDIIKDKQKLFPKGLQWLITGNEKLMEWEDWIFLKHHYKVALSNYLAVNKVDLNNMSEEILQRARYRALTEAQRNTYRDFSEFAKILNEASKKNKGMALLVEGLMPFKKTPINVLKRGVSYSPAGLVKVIFRDAFKVRSGDITASEWIDSLAQGLTGCGVVALGMLFTSLGYIVGASGDEKEKEFEELLGGQNYALVIGDHSYTLDWLAPFSLPFFVGVEIMELVRRDEKLEPRAAFEALLNLAEPMLEMSMLSGLTDAIETTQNASSAQKVAEITMGVIKNYIGQGIPTLFGQIARTIDDTQRRTYDDKNSFVPGFIQRAGQTMVRKIPGASKKLQPYVDEWGRKKVTDGVFKRALINMLSPGYYSKIESSEMEEELKRLYDEVGNEDGMSLFPSAAVKKFNLSDDTEKNLTAEEYTTMQEVQGQSAYKLLTDIVASKKYGKLDDLTKGKIVSKVYEIASAKGKKAIAGDMWNPNTKWISEMLELIDNGNYSEAENYIVEKGIEQVEESRYEAAKVPYKEEFNFDTSKYNEAEIRVIEKVQSDWAGYNASIDMGREIDESDYRHIKVYEDKLSDEMPIEEYADIRAYAKKTAAMADGKENMKKKELINYLNSTDYSLAVKSALFEAIGNSNWKNPY